MTQILVIEDDTKLRGLLKEMLERNNYDVIVAADGEIGIRMFRETPTQLVITDIIMPNKEGVETIFELQEYFPDVKVIAMSGGGRSMPGDYLDMVEKISNVVGTLMKPFAMNELLALVKKQLG